MIARPYWQNRLEAAWRTRPIVWLSGVRRVGKTVLSQALPGCIYMNCDLVSTVRRLEDPEAYFGSLPAGSRLILDEVHRLPDPSRVLKIAADAFPGLRVLATGSSTLEATGKFADSLTGRKWSVHLLPVLWDECQRDFGIADLDRRLLAGGLPEPLLAGEPSPGFCAEWMESFFARDIAELFRVRDRNGFLTLLRLLFMRSGGQADLTRLSRECGISRPTVVSYLDGMSVAHAVFPLRPFHGGGTREYVRIPKIYVFDTGFAAFARGWEQIRDDDRGPLWEHLVLDTLRSSFGDGDLAYWRDKAGREVDFIVRRGRRVDAVECKINPDGFDAGSLAVFRAMYSDGENLLVCPHVVEPYIRTVKGLRIRVIPTSCIHGLRDGQVR
jgi:predicted AAA+ superfamily ATPase